MNPVRAERKRGADWATRAYVRLIEPRRQNLLPGGLAFWARWEDTGGVIKQTNKQTNIDFLVSCGFEQGKNEPCVFRHKELGVTLASYVDDLLVKGLKPAVEDVLSQVAERFRCKEPIFLGQDSPIDHLGMYIEETKDAVFLSMHNYIDGMVVKLGMEEVEPGRVPLPHGRAARAGAPSQRGRRRARARGQPVSRRVQGAAHSDGRYPRPGPGRHVL